MNPHPAADLFPMMPEDELRALADDIAANGLNQPIVTHNGKILDGRNRFKACQLAMVQPETIEWEDPGCGPVAWVVSQNIQRRHLTASQRAALAVDLLPELEAEAKERQGSRSDLNFVEKVPQSNEARSRDRAAELVQVNERYVSDAKRIASKRPDLFNKMKDGGVSIREAIGQVRGSAKQSDPSRDDRENPGAARSNRLSMRSNAHADRVERLTGMAQAITQFCSELNLELAFNASTKKQRKQWERHLKNGASAMNQLRREIRENEK